MRSVNLVVIHCSDSDHAYHDNVSTIRKWHVEENGWSDIGYHYFIQKNGRLNICRPISIKGSHVRAYNSASIGICLSGKSINRFSTAQLDTLNGLLLNLIRIFDLDVFDVVGHCELDNNKTCPNISMDIIRSRLLIISNQKG